MTLEKIVVGPLEVNCYILGSPDTGEALLVDPGAEPEKIKSRLTKLGLCVKLIINTHGHFDHIGTDTAFAVPAYIHRQDLKLLKDPQRYAPPMIKVSRDLPKEIRFLEDGQLLKLQEIELKVLHTPGHTPGGLCLNAGSFVFTGDTLFAQGVGRTDLPGASAKELLHSIQKKLLVLADDLVIYPGHGPASTIGEEKRSNPFLCRS